MRANVASSLPQQLTFHVSFSPSLPQFTTFVLMSKFIFVSGGVISGIGKGIVSSSIGVILKSYGLKISMIKADPYMNVDAGTMNPLEHGETFVLEDGFETDMDIGTYERFTGETFGRENSMTSGAVFAKVIKDERALAYDGKWVSIDYHVPDVIIKWIKRVARNAQADVTIIEIGGTVGEIGNKLFLEANRIMKVQRPDDVLHIHLSYLPIPSNIGEMKSKPVQLSVKELNSSGINPEFLFARASTDIDAVRMEKLSSYCTIPKEHIIPAPDIDNIYRIPINFEQHELGKKLIKALKLRKKKTAIVERWQKKVTRIYAAKKPVVIGVIAKYYRSGNFDLKDSYASVVEAIKHAAWEQSLIPQIEWLVSDDLENDTKRQKILNTYDGIIVPQGWGSRGVEGKIKAVEIARKEKLPFLGLCFGMQMAVIEYARHVLGLSDATSEEADSASSHQIIHLMEDQKKFIKQKNFGGTIRLGAWPCVIKKGSLLEKQYKTYPNSLFNRNSLVMERHRHRYEFNNDYREQLEQAGMHIVGTSPDQRLVEAIELDASIHPFFIGTQFHPELKSHFLEPHPLFMGFIKACTERKKREKTSYRMQI